MIGISYEPTPSEILNVVVSSSSSTLPVTVAQVKEYLNFTGTAKDTEIQRMINSAVKHIERYINKTIVERTYAVTFRPGDYTPLPFGPVVSITSVVSSYNGTDTTIDAGNYYTEGDNLMINQYGTLSAGWNYGRINVTYVSGMLRDDESGSIDDDIKEAIIMQSASNFLKGEASAGLTNKVKQYLDLVADKRYFK